MPLVGSGSRTGIGKIDSGGPRGVGEQSESVGSDC
jgi:hypothetical protein